MFISFALAYLIHLPHYLGFRNFEDLLGVVYKTRDVIWTFLHPHPLLPFALCNVCCYYTSYAKLRDVKFESIYYNIFFHFEV